MSTGLEGTRTADHPREASWETGECGQVVGQARSSGPWGPATPLQAGAALRALPGPRSWGLQSDDLGVPECEDRRA